MAFWSGIVVVYIVGAAMMCVVFVAVALLPTENTPELYKIPSMRWVGASLALTLGVGFLSPVIHLHKSIMVMLFVGAVLFAARSKGFVGGGIVATIMGLMLVYLLPPFGAMRVNNVQDRVLIILFMLCTVAGSYWLDRRSRAY